MYEFLVSGMTCGSCVKSVSSALKNFDPTSEVSVDLKEQKVKVISEQSQIDIQTAIEEAGYSVIKANKIS